MEPLLNNYVNSNSNIYKNSNTMNLSLVLKYKFDSYEKCISCASILTLNPFCISQNMSSVVRTRKFVEKFNYSINISWI